MSEDFPLFPELSADGEKEALLLLEKFKEKLKRVADEAIGDLYVDMSCYIESDAWTNFRVKLMDGLRNYDNRKIQSMHDFKEIRKQIYKEFRDEIIEDLDQDNVEKIEELEEQVKRLKEMLNRR